MSSEQEFDRIWKALSDPTRRRLLDLLSEAPRTTSQLASEFELSRFAIMKHLNVLEGAGLLQIERQGRERWNHLDKRPLVRIYDRWLSQQTAWEPTLDDAPAPAVGLAPEAAPPEDLEDLLELMLFVRPEEKHAVQRAIESVVPPVYTSFQAIGRGGARVFLPKVGFTLCVPRGYVDPILRSIASALRLEGGPNDMGTGFCIVSKLEEERIIGSARTETGSNQRALAEGWGESP